MSTPLLEIDGLVKDFGALRALDGMSFEVRSGEVFGFVGGNGAGKTTTMRIVLGVMAASSGEARWQGKPVTFHTRRTFGYMPEERGLYPKMKVRDQLGYFAEAHGMTKKDASRSVAYWTERQGIDGVVDQEVQKLSLGNQQRVQLGAALVHDPEVLILDEPFSGLDPLAVDVMTEVLREKADSGVPVMFSSHQLDLVERLCDRVGIVAKGRIRACDTVTALRSEGSGALQVAVDTDIDWASSLANVRVLERDANRWTLALEDGVDDQEVLRAALAAGPVRAFYRRERSLTELYRDVVRDEPKETDETEVAK